MNPGEHGRISFTQLPDGRQRARARYRDFTGRRKQVEAIGRSKARAEKVLLQKLAQVMQTSGDDISGTTTVAQLSTVYLAHIRASDNWVEQSVQRYEAVINGHILAGLGELRLMEVAVSRVANFLRTLNDRTPGAAATCRTVLNGMFRIAVEHDALKSNPVRDITLPTRKKKPVQALTVDEVDELRAGLREWENEPGVHGPARGTELSDLVDIMLGSGIRIGEALALRWSDVDLAASKPTITVSATMAYIKGKGNRRQTHPKTEAGYRIITVPDFVVDVLLRRSVEAVPTESDAVFPSGKGTFRWPNNVRRGLRSALEDMKKDGWIHPHVLRKTMATLAATEKTLEEVAAILGQVGTRTARNHYVKRAAVAPDATSVLERFGGNRIEKDE
ncbi:tyrosine-type recombinase/integrase [Brevibacterium moorei]|uniref:tyrosine-type recombinase/integrase n=1 Tax=Brevibacterium moorei TaxID=2968457 RepID=UPI00211BC4C0|nr:site-specific integrase [Brevibacterium sp. 68QC2CO]MCQ9386797.1 site-specific integrase [Brevibacterium sp. 68QC2CO]